MTESLYYLTTECVICRTYGKELMTITEICQLVNNCPDCSKVYQVEGADGHMKLWLRDTTGTGELEPLASRTTEWRR